MKSLIRICCLCLVAVSAPISAQTAPGKTIRLIVGFPAGGSSDALARLLAERLGGALSQPIVVHNRPGAAGNIAAEVVVRAEPDGHTLLLGSTASNAVNPNLYTKLRFDVVKGLIPVTLVATGMNALVVHPSVPAKNIQELIALARGRPGELTFASAGVGSSMHLQAEMFKQMAGVDILHVPYKGAAPAVVDLLSGYVDMAIAAEVTVVPLARDGRLKLLGTTGAARSFLSPGTPTIGESGLPGYDMTTWYGVFAPTGTPAEFVNRLHAELRKIVLSPQYREKLGTVGFEPAASGSPSEFRSFQASEIAKWGRIISALGLRVE